MTISACGKPSNIEPEPEDNLLFEHGISGETQIYNYAPTIFQEDENTRYIYYCSNKIEGNVTDFIAYRKGVKDEKGVWKYSDVSYVVGPTEDTWDSRHTCDPSVVKGKFSYNNESYNYIMAYLGCVTSNNQENKVGIAVAKKPEGPWIKVDEINPIADYKRNTSDDLNNTFQWGYGQPSIINLDKQSQILLTYTYGDGRNTGVIAEKWDLSNLDNPVKLKDGHVTIKGLKNLNGGQDIFSNADFAYDSVNKRFYVVADSRPFEDTYPNFIASSNKVAYIYDGNSEEIGDVLFNAVGTSWNQIDEIDKSSTGFDRNHNSGILTDEYGWTIDKDNISVVYTVSNESLSFWEAHSQYRLYMINIKVKE